MTSSKPYLLRAMFEWLVDNELTPYLLVDATHPTVAVPQEYVNDGNIILNISPDATAMLNMSNESVTFDASFNQIPQQIYAPIRAVKAIYAFENGKGMVFDEDEEDEVAATPQSPADKKSKKTTLKVVK